MYYNYTPPVHTATDILLRNETTSKLTTKLNEIVVMFVCPIINIRIVLK